MSMAFSDQLIERIKHIAPAGFRLVRNATLTEPVKDFVEGMPAAWCALYIERGYAMADPVFLWSVHNSGVKRWSEITIDDFQNVLEKAKEFGLNFGLVISRIEQGRFSIFSASRSDREYTDAEILICHEIFEEAISEGLTDAAIKPKDLEVLRSLSKGHSLEEIAEFSGVAISTIKNRLSRARRALNAKTSVEAVANAIRRKLI